MIGIIDYGAGNTKSVMNSLQRLHADFILSDKQETLLACDRLILPGVGHASQAMHSLKEKQLDKLIKSYKKPLLGICLGMQLLCSHSEEGNTDCLGITKDKVFRFPKSVGKIPAMGWNTLEYKANTLTTNIENNSYMYFIHSYYVSLSENTIAIAEYGIKYTAALQYNNFYGMQFHPEKSAESGSQLLQNFLKL